MHIISPQDINVLLVKEVTRITHTVQHYNNAICLTCTNFTCKEYLTHFITKVAISRRISVLRKIYGGKRLGTNHRGKKTFLLPFTVI